MIISKFSHRRPISLYLENWWVGTDGNKYPSFKRNKFDAGTGSGSRLRPSHITVVRMCEVVNNLSVK